MKKVLFLLLLLFLPLASAEELHDYQSLDLKHTISNSLILTPSTSNFYITSATITLLWIPKDDFRQETISMSTVPSADIDGDNLVFEFDHPEENELDISVESLIRTRSDYRRVTNKISFPIENFDPVLAEYLYPSEIIDVNDDIVDLANSLSAGKDDLYEVVFSFAEWVEDNVDYNLSTITSEAAQKSSWVLTNRYGVCDEITSLFISLNRAVGIPARFVSGISHTDLDYFADPWGPHGWAEVYFPGVGWVPFDVTYKQLGWTDATHIKLRESVDAGDSSVEYNAKGRGFDMVGGTLDNEVEVVTHGALQKSNIDINLKIEKPQIGFGSYNMLTAELENKNNFYVSAYVQLGSTQNVENLDDRYRHVLLKPLEKTKLYFIVRISDDLKSGYIYTFPMTLVLGSESKETSFKAKRSDSIYGYDYFADKIPKVSASSAPIELFCSADKESAKIGESIIINCEAENSGSRVLKSLDICLDDDCSKMDIGLDEVVTFDFSPELTAVGVKNFIISVGNNNFVVKRYILIRSLDDPSIIISNFDAPKSVAYGEISSISFVVEQDSFSEPEDILVSVDGKRFSESWVVYDFTGKNEFVFTIPTKIMSSGSNDLKIVVEFKDDKGIEYAVQKNFSIDMTNVDFWDKILIFFNRLNYKMSGWFENI
ncbi:transglutaminase domain-containing protein [archaeon]|nr:transglutaminase domain-containing protein [archaeon]MBL7056921.1 transglutaminase domain-containing protein [Candidatus Woesearchaeota archaeon]